MPQLVYKKETAMPCPADVLFRWHETPDAFQKLMPPGEPVKVLHHDGHVRNGARAILLVGYWPVRLRWELKHEGYIQGQQFCDVQVRGPFAAWKHQHRMIATEKNTSVLADHIHFKMPLGWLGWLIGKYIMLPKLNRLFSYRHKVTLASLMKEHAA